MNLSSSSVISSSICINLAKIKDTIFYMDESWVYVDETKEKSWYYRDLLACFHPQKKSGKFSVMVSYQFNFLCEFLGKRPMLMVLHIGSNDGFLRDKNDRDVALIIRGKSSKRDYHKNTNSSKFEDYMINSVLSNLSDHSVAVLDNCSYHKRIENKKQSYSSTRKQVFIDFSRKNGDKVSLFPSISLTVSLIFFSHSFFLYLSFSFPVPRLQRNI